MQRRWVALYAAFFVVIAAGAYSVIALALQEGTNITLATDDQYVVHFENADVVQLSPNVAEYQSQHRLQDAFQERMTGLWTVVFLSSLTAILLIGFAYLPVRG